MEGPQSPTEAPNSPHDGCTPCKVLEHPLGQCMQFPQPASPIQRQTKTWVSSDGIGARRLVMVMQVTRRTLAPRSQSTGPLRRKFD